MSKVLERRNSFGGITPTSSASDSSKQHEKQLPHYLRASTGSCHDLCKHGHKNPLEEKLKLSGGRRKKVPSHLNNLVLHGSVILDTPKDVRSRNFSLANSSISLGEADRTADKIKSENLRGVVSSEHLVRRTASSADNKSVKSDSRKKHPMVAQRFPANPTNSSGILKFDQKPIRPVKGLEEKTLQEKATTAKLPSIKRPASFPTKLNSINQVSVPSQASNNLVSSKERNTLNRKLTSPPATINGGRTCNSNKSGRSSTRSSSANINQKEDLDMSRTLFSIESELTASVAKQEDDMHVSCITGHNVESTLAVLPSDAAEYVDMTWQTPEAISRFVSEDVVNMSRTSLSTDSELTASVELQEDDEQGSCIAGHDVHSTLELFSGTTLNADKSRPAPDREGRFILEADGGVESNENSEALAAECPAKSIICLELKQSFGDQEIKTMPSTSTLEHIQREQCVIASQASIDEEKEADDIALCELSKQLTTVGSEDIYDSVLIENRSEGDFDGVKVNTSLDSVIPGSKEEVAADKDLKVSPELLSLDEKGAEDPDSCLHCTNVVESVKADETLEVKNINSTSHYLSISETLSDGELLEEPKSVLTEPVDSNIKIDELTSVSNDVTFELEELKSRIIVPQLPEELSDDEYYEEYGFELSESDDSGAEDVGATINKNGDKSPKPAVQRPRRISSLHLDDDSPTPYKLKFKRGKVVELTPDSSGPRRLKFRRKAEVVNVEGLSGRRIYKRNIANDSVTRNPEKESPGVKLRHQDAQDKKDAQGLFNNVIEETASKLAESRKSKVKALVGAFETVISLQDGNPTPSTPQTGNSPYPVHNDEEKKPEEAA